MPIKLVNRILDRLGLKLVYSYKNDVVKYYKLDEELATDSDRQNVTLTTANIDDRQPVHDLLSGLFGKIFER